ncbi:YcnI family protein [Aldersonia sp. NBC_00410]|uniref:YcnI family copper-binding membrane protein n=1 Tax=Aldersonia sp. NBC_00410 TaxID=2975954 RepID=UPI00225B203A|nr:YcnI family protein [Aldersonia sp. NBC_00410]MCX5045102.1 YcnI family protein [Aldersonia sp. NBC_00410]
MDNFISRTTFTRAALTTTASVTAVFLAGGIASAHVTVDAPGATQGGYTVLTFKVPTESDTASTTKLTVTLPEFKSARPEPIPGWQSAVEKNADQEVTAVTWTADPGAPGIPVGQFQRFALSVGPLPDQDEVSFTASQTYSDGQVVDWNQPMGSDGSEPEHPTPSVTLAEGSGDDHHAATATADHHDSEEASDTDTADSTARWLGGIGLALGAIGAALGIGAYVRGRSQ